MGDVVPELIALPHKQVAELAGVSARRLKSWWEIGLVRPTFERRLSDRTWVRLYGYYELLEALVVAELVGRGVATRHVHEIVDRLRSRGRDAPLSQVTFASRGSEVYFQEDDGEWEAGRRGQIVLAHVLHLEPLCDRILAAVRQRRGEPGAVERVRGRAGGKPVFAGTRVSVAVVKELLSAGQPAAEVSAAYPSLEEADVETAVRELGVA